MLLRTPAWLLAALAVAACRKPPPPPGPLSPAAAQKAQADLLQSIDAYVKTKPTIAQLASVLDPGMDALQGDPSDPAPANLGVLRAAPDPQLSGLDAYSPVVVKSAQAALRESLRREPTADEVVARIANVEDRQVNEISAALQAQGATIAAIYDDMATLKQQGKAAEALMRQADLRTLRQAAIDGWYKQNGLASEAAGAALAPADSATTNRELLFTYLNAGSPFTP